jgi:transposase
MSKKRVRAPDWKEMRRYRAIELKREGWTLEEIAEALDVSTRSVKKWMKAVREEGEIGLQARPHLGASPRLPAEELALLPELLAAGAEAYGFRGEVWTSARIAVVIEWEFGISYHKSHVSRLLKALAWTPQKPVTHATQRDEKEIERWRTEVWPELKKRRATKAG